MAKFKILFLPDNKEVEVERGTTIRDAAEQAGVNLESTCGGLGVCGECRVRVDSGKAKTDKDSIAFFSKEELQAGYVLACQTPIEDNLVVTIPAKTRGGGDQILTEGKTVTYSEPGNIALHRVAQDPATFFKPLVTKVYLELPEPTLTDNISDIERIVRALNEKGEFPAYEITLACLQGLAETLRLNNWKVTATVTWHGGIGRITRVEPGDTSSDNYGLAIDIGTTTVVAQLVHLPTGSVVGVEASHNLQSRYGADVISRMIYACSTSGSLGPVHQAVIANINSLAQTLCTRKNINPDNITCAVAAGNTTMAHFFLGLIPCSIRLHPYVPTTMFYPQVTARDLAIKTSPEAVIETLPSVASYVGGDTVAGVLACGMSERPEVRCLIDVGTNGEIVVGNNEWLVCASASAGPAFEGAGSKWGMRATRGAIEKIEIKDGKVTYQTIGNEKPRGICGSGLIDAIYELVRSGIIDKSGKFHTEQRDGRVIIVDNIPEYILALPEESESGEAVTISESDISNLIKSKGAMYAATKSLIDYVGINFEQLETVYLAGGFGSSLDVRKGVAIGLLPDIDPARIQYLGNSSVMGARMALLSVSSLQKCQDIAKKMTNIELSNYPNFMNEFIAALFLPHTDSNLFPSVKY